MTTRRQTPPPCPRKCRGGHKCRCSAGHKAPCICGDMDCECHTPRAYGLLLRVRNGREEYVKVGEREP